MINRLRVTYFICANTAILLIVALVGTDLAIRVRRYVMPRFSGPALTAAELANYGHMTAGDREDLRLAMRVLRVRYEPEVGFLHQATTSRFLNIDNYGIRANGPVTRPIASMQGAVWLLGGSTAFGDGVADAETIPAHLERILNREVVNLGVRSYAGAEENRLVKRYARIGYLPTHVVFFDGINERCDNGPYVRDMARIIVKAQDPYDWDPGRPITYTYDRLLRKFGLYRGETIDGPEPFTPNCRRHGKEQPLATLHTRMMRERAAMCRLYGLACTTFVQPFAGLHGRTDQFAQEFLDGEAQNLRLLFAHLEGSWRDAGALFLTDALDGDDRHGFIDEFHYSAATSQRIAAAIAARLVIGAPPDSATNEP